MEQLKLPPKEQKQRIKFYDDVKVKFFIFFIIFPFFPFFSTAMKNKFIFSWWKARRKALGGRNAKASSEWVSESWYVTLNFFSGKKEILYEQTW